MVPHEALNMTRSESIEKTIRERRLFFAGPVARRNKKERYTQSGNLRDIGWRGEPETWRTVLRFGKDA